MSTELATKLASGSIDASLAEVDIRSRGSEWSATGDIVVGPFGVLNFNTSNTTTVNPRTSPPERIDSPSDFSNSPEGVAAGDPSSLEVGSLFNIEDFLQWDDLLGLESDLFGTTVQAAFDPLSPRDLSSDAPISEAGISDMAQRRHRQSRVAHDAHDCESDTQLVSSRQIMAGVLSSSVDVLTDAPFLLKHFRDHLIAELMPLPTGEKSPWTILNIPVAMLTLSELTFFSERRVNHARMANFYSILACSAYHLSSNPSRDLSHSAEYWKHIANQTYHEAKNHIQQSLKTELYGPRKAKYKDQLMAIEGMSAFAVLSCRQKDARSYMVDAERLLRIRGLSKREISRKARLLHHIYTWNRIVGESTYVLHDHSLSGSFTETFSHHFLPQLDQTGNDRCRQVDHNPRLDDFLRLRPRQLDSDLDIDEPKERETGLYDIHLEDSRRFSETLYSQIYGIPETWLSLLSQTTRLANVMDALVRSGNTRDSTNSEAWQALQRRSNRLENMVCSLALRGNSVSRLDSPESVGRSHMHMIHAMNVALVIFFYRRIRNVHPIILQGHVDDVITSLNEFDIALAQSGLPGPGTGWPAFIAGCEAVTTSRRDALLRWIEKGGARSGFAVFDAAKEVIMEVWKEQDEHRSSSTRCGDPHPTWVEVLKRRKLWPIFC
ncbi:hypothetical protein MAP00_002249 [Monascus purpureus]|nr:hypothetical protein MAP00_002249 [Monascus purpureus]